jgi:hypothetical protein
MKLPAYEARARSPSTILVVEWWFPNRSPTGHRNRYMSPSEVQTARRQVLGWDARSGSKPPIKKLIRTER